MNVMMIVAARQNRNRVYKKTFDAEVSSRIFAQCRSVDGDWLPKYGWRDATNHIDQSSQRSRQFTGLRPGNRTRIIAPLIGNDAHRNRARGR
jgi:hypothetical protein